MNEKTVLIDHLNERHVINRRWNISRHITTLLKIMQRWRQNARTRKQLADLPAHLHQDIGLSHRQICQESDKKFWQ